MGDQRGFTLVELVVTLALITLLGGMATWSVAGLLTSLRLSGTASRLADEIALARSTAIARHQRWRIEIPTPTGSSDAVTSYRILHCERQSLPCDPANPSHWKEERSGSAVRRTAIRVVAPAPVTGAPTRLQFDETGRLHTSGTLQIEICPLAPAPPGVIRCQAGGSASPRKLTVERYSGVLH